MSEALKPCPFCGTSEPHPQSNGYYYCVRAPWNTRPIEDKLTERIAALEAEPSKPGLSDEYWDNHAVQCGNCDTWIITKGGRRKGKNNGLSEAEGEDEALCGGCAGDDMYHLDKENAALEAENARLREALERIKHTMWICETPLDVIDRIARTALEDKCPLT